MTDEIEVIPKGMRVFLYSKAIDFKQFYFDLLRNREFVLSMLQPKSLMGILGHPYDVMKELKYAAENKNLLGNQYDTDQRSSSGYDYQYTREQLEEMKEVDWKRFFKYVEDECKHTVKAVWVVQYKKNGRHRWHRDKRFSGTHRWIISLCCEGKEFWLRCNGGKVRHVLRHGSVVIMNTMTSGLKQEYDMQHGGFGNADGSWAVVLETVAK